MNTPNVTAVIASLLMIVSTTSGAQVRTPIATAPLTTTEPGPAPTNVKAVATGPTAVTVSWDAAAGVRSYLVERRQTDNPTCCVSQSGLLTTSSWQDAALTADREYSFVVTAVYTDGRSGQTEVTAATPYAGTVSLSTGALAASSDGVLKLTPCAARRSGGPDPGPIGPGGGSTPGSTTIMWYSPSPDGTNYVVDRAPYGTTTWTFVGSTCGGPSPVVVNPTDPTTGKSQVWTRDLAGGIRPNGKYTYRVTRVGSKGEVGWQAYTWYAPCATPPTMTATASGSTVTVTWGTSVMNCSIVGSVGSAETYMLTSSFGYVKSKSAYGFTKDVIYGVPLGTHTFTLVAGWRPDAVSRPSSTTVTVQY